MFQILVGKENFLTEVSCVPQVLHVNAVTEDFFRRSLKAEAGRISLLGFSVPSGKYRDSNFSVSVSPSR